jgi:hypothetical protein
MSLIKGVFLTTFTVIFLNACTKPDDVPVKPTTPTPEPEPEVPADTRTYQQRLADSLYKYAQQIYYWNTQLPDSVTFKPLNYGQFDTLVGLKNELLAITRIAINPATGKPYEQYTSYQNGASTDVNTTSKYSYIVATSDLYGGGVANIIANQDKVKELKMTLDGKENELGFTIGFARVSYLTGTPKAMTSSPQDSIIGLVRIVTKGSPAWNAGVRRGDLISKFNGNTLTYSNNLTQISNALNGNTLALTTYDPVTKKENTMSFSKTVYTFNPVFRDTMVTVGSKKIAYIAYKSFTVGDNTQPALRAAFDKFSGATDLVIDLRYNGGGYVSSAEFFANSILPTNANGGVLFKEIYNTTMQNKQAILLKNQPVYLNNIKQSYSYFDIDYSIAGNTEVVKKEGAFNAGGTITSLYFIVSSSTASASELLINSLKPYFNNQVYLINAPFSSSDNPDYTYGKPIGFFEIRLGKYSVYMSNFESKNKNDEGGYYQGMKTDIKSNDDIRYDLGDPSEASFLAAIRKITGNATYQPTLSTTSRSVYSIASQVIAPLGKPTKVFDMIETPERK